MEVSTRLRLKVTLQAAWNNFTLLYRMAYPIIGIQYTFCTEPLQRFCNVYRLRSTLKIRHMRGYKVAQINLKSCHMLSEKYLHPCTIHILIYTQCWVALFIFQRFSHTVLKWCSSETDCILALQSAMLGGFMQRDPAMEERRNGEGWKEVLWTFLGVCRYEWNFQKLTLLSQSDWLFYIPNRAGWGSR